MEKKKLKKLKINKMSEFPVIGDQEQMMMKGGYTITEAEQMMNNGTWTGGYVDGLGYVGTEVTVYGDAPVGPQSECPQCQQWLEQHDRNAAYGGFELTPIGKWLLNTLPHSHGWGNHQ